MLDLTFGEQVKIILRRKGMTIKELAAIIEEVTGKKMSRQNLTQRLGRDNFQEQDMRMIAEILGCQFRLSILDESNSAEKKLTTVTEQNIEEKKEDVAETLERDITIGELVDIHQELDELEEAIELEQSQEQEAVPVEEEPEAEYYEEEYVEEEPEAEHYEEEYVEEVPEAEYYEEEYVEEEPEAEYYEEEYVEEEPTSVEDILREMEALENESKGYSREKAARHEPEKKSHGWKSYLQFKRKKDEQVMEEPVEEVTVETEDEPVLYLEDDADLGEDGLAEVDENEPVGDVNPYTGREYETNSVRIHPKRIGYVQVYDRSEHQWTDMTEWAFLGYQERKKALLGKDYEPPIYLD